MRRSAAGAWLTAIGAAALSAGTVLGNGAPRPLPRPEPAPEPRPPVVIQPAQPVKEPEGVKSRLTIEARDDVNESILVIPRSLAAGAPKPGNVAPGNAPAEAPKGAAGRPLNARDAVAGLALSLAVVVGGMTLVRRSGGAMRPLVLAVAGAGVLGSAGLLMADIPGPGPRPRPRPPIPPQPPVEVQPPIPLPAIVSFTGPVYVQISDTATECKLIVNRRLLARLSDTAAKPVANPGGGNVGGGKIPVDPPVVNPRPQPQPGIGIVPPPPG